MTRLPIRTPSALRVLVAAITLLAIPLPGHAALTTGLAAYYGFDGSGADFSGNGRDVSLFGGAGFATGLFGQALDLHRNISQFAQRPADDAVLNFGSGEFTIQTWVSFNSISGEQVLMEKFSGMSGPGWTLSMVNDSWAFRAWHFYALPSAWLASPSQTIELGVWHQVLIRREGIEFDLFYDGTVVASTSNPNAVPDTSMPLLIGKRNDLDGRGFPLDGRIDETAIWTRALSDNEVAYLYNRGAGNPIVPEPTSLVVWCLLGALGICVAWWRRRRAFSTP